MKIMDLTEKGYDCDFVNDVLEELKCGVCRLVLREPVQLVRCGHRICKSCLNQTKTHENDSNITFMCPLDRQTIDSSQVFPDNAANRSILNLNVYCSYKAQGCLWFGELQNLKEHAEVCPGNIKMTSGINARELLHKIGNLEESLKKKDQEAESLKQKVAELEGVVNKLGNSLEQLPNSTNPFHEPFQLKLNVLCSQAMTYDWTISFDALVLAEVLSEFFYPANLPSVCFQMSANILDNSLRVWIRRCRGKNDSKSGKVLFSAKGDFGFEFYLAGVDRRVKKRSLAVSGGHSGFVIGNGYDRSIGNGWNQFLNSLSTKKEKWVIDNKLHLYCKFEFK